MAERAAEVFKNAQVRAKWSDDADQNVVFADEVHFINVGDRCYLTFGQVRLPVTTGSPDGIVAEIQPVAKIVITQELLHKFVDLLKSATEK
jgi:hypothetical protein